MMRRASLLVIGCLLAAVGCDLLRFDAPLPPGAVRMIPPPQYKLWWQLTERCSGRTGDLSRISWYMVPGVHAFRAGYRDMVQGMYYPAGTRIAIAGDSRDDGLLVRHEMLHALLPGVAHPREYFQQLCGGVVACEQDCVAEGGGTPPVDSSGAIVRPRDLIVLARADSTVTSISRDSGWVVITISVTNPYSSAVRVRLAGLPPDSIAAATFGYRQGYCNDRPFSDPDYYYVLGRWMVLGRGETQRMTFDVRMQMDCSLYRPFFNDDTLPDLRVVVEP